MNKIIIAPRETGKSTFLLAKIKSILNENKPIAILDSATDHKSKSLIYKFLELNQDFHLIKPNLTKDIIIPSSVNDYYTACIQSDLFKNMVKHKNKTICIDLSYFLEKGHYFSDINDKTSARYYRNMYNLLSQQTAVCLMALTKLDYLPSITVFGDEIEFPICEIDISTFQDANTQFICGIHKENAFGTFYKGFKHLKLNTEHIDIVKDKDTLCGSACINYILKQDKPDARISRNEVWCSNIAETLLGYGYNIELRCFNSRLYQDALTNTDDFDGFKSIQNYLQYNNIYQVAPTIDVLNEEILCNRYCIYNVSSQVFNKDSTMIGGHYIIASTVVDGLVQIINPRQIDYKIQYITLEELQSCIKDFGSWRIIIKK